MLKARLGNRVERQARQTSQADSTMIQILDLVRREFKIAMIKMLRALMEEVDNVQE